MAELSTQLAFLGLPGGSEWIIVLVIAVLLFGRRLPEIARSMGQSVTEFKRGINSTKAEIEDAATQAKSLDTDSRSVSQSAGTQETTSTTSPNS
ncbi:MAG: twin-arginine translocase TatA/TatE family subunit [Planctomycetota bacterium]